MDLLSCSEEVDLQTLLASNLKRPYELLINRLGREHRDPCAMHRSWGSSLLITALTKPTTSRHRNPAPAYHKTICVSLHPPTVCAEITFIPSCAHCTTTSRFSFGTEPVTALHCRQTVRFHKQRKQHHQKKNTGIGGQHHKIENLQTQV